MRRTASRCWQEFRWDGTLYGLLGAVIAVAAGDLPLYVVTQFGATREGVKPLWQDLQLTVCFLACFWELTFFLRRSF